MSTFDYRRNRRQQLVAKGEPVDNNISFDGKTKDFLNMFANKMKDTNNLYQSQRFPEFDDQTSDVVRQNLIGQSDGYGQFNDMEKQIKSDAFVNKFQEAGGSMVMLAKGNRSKMVVQACKKHGGFYLGSIGGSAARLAQNCIKKVQTLEYEDLGMEAIRKIEVKDFPAFIITDDKGNDFFLGDAVS